MAQIDDFSSPDEATAIRADSSDARPRSLERFTPGVVIADRFRIIAPLGHGGMGEVYRADDIKLGQQVALKFLPPEVEADREKLQRLYAEVRLGRQVSHPNVCRLYDILEWNGSHFIAMEYIDGEDLGSLLRRIGKLPQEKALELMHDICTGLAAAHGVGIIHRDLKPANIMIDGRGRARVTDFGLAAIAVEAAAGREIAGTPAYMAPEQLRGDKVTQRTDLYALGLIFLEMLTGKGHQSKTSEKSSASRGDSSRTALSEQTKDVDPAVQRVILRCLEPDADSRPPSIHAVIAALPGADPLQAALDAGETPSPEMVAAAGATGELRPASAIPLLVLAIVLVLAAFAVIGRSRLTSIVPLPLKPDALAQRGREIAAMIGNPRPVDTAYVLGPDWSSLEAARRRGKEAVREAATLRPVPIRFSYRESPAELVPLVGDRAVAAVNDPPLNVPGMLRMQLDPAGMLVEFIAVPPAHDSSAQNVAAPDWEPVLRAAGFDPRALKPIAPEWTAPVDTDAKLAWTGTYPDQPAVPMRIEAASYRGQVVFFSVIPPWKTPPQTAGSVPPSLVWWTRTFFTVGLTAILIAGAVLARRNTRRGRTDRRGAAIVGVTIFILMLAASLLRSAHSADPAMEWTLINDAMKTASLFGAVSWVMYLAIEPYLRRRWPRTLVSWSRLLAGRFSDPLIGRDLLVGTVAGATSGVVWGAMLLYVGGLGMRFGSSLVEMRHIAFLFLHHLVVAGTFALIIGAFLLISHLVVRHRGAAIVATTLIVMSLWGSPGIDPVAELTARLIIAAVLVGVYVRFGVLAAACTYFVQLIVFAVPTSLDPSSWVFGRTIITIVAILTIAGYGFYRSLGAQPLFARAVLDD